MGLGDPAATTLKHESALWRSTMQRLHCDDGRALLEEQQAAEEEDEEADAESVTGGVRSAEASVVSASAVSAASAGAAATSQGLRQTLLLPDQLHLDGREYLDVFLLEIAGVGSHEIQPLAKRFAGR